MEHLPGLIEALYVNDYYSTGVHDCFWINTGGSYKTALMHLDLGKQRKTLALNLSELLYLNSIVYILANHLAKCSGAIVDVMNYSTLALASSEFIEPQSHYSKHSQYPQLYEKLKALILM
jgi:hypothetical protein